MAVGYLENLNQDYAGEIQKLTGGDQALVQMFLDLIQTARDLNTRVQALEAIVIP